MEAKEKFGLTGWMLVLCFFLLPMEGLGLIRFGAGGYAGGLTYAKLAIVASIGLWAVRVLFTRDLFPVYSLYANSTTIFLVFGLVVGMASIITERSHLLFGAIFMQAVSLFALYFVMINVIKVNLRLYQWVFAAMLIMSFANSMGGIYEILTGDMILKGRRQTAVAPGMLTRQHGLYQTESGKNRIASFSGDTGGHGVHWAVYGSLFLAIPFLFKKPWMKIAAWGATIITLVNCLATGTRTAMGGLLVGGIVFFVFAKIRYRYLIAAGVLLATLVLAVAFKSPLERVLGKSHKAHIGVNWRLAQSKVAMLMIRKHPILGVGMGNYVGLYHIYNRTVPDTPKTPFIMHNGFLAVWAEQGTLGLIFFVATFVSVFFILVQVYRNPANHYVEIVALGLLAATAAHIVCQFGYPLLGDEQGYFMMGFAVALRTINLHLLGRLPSVALA